MHLLGLGRGGLLLAVLLRSLRTPEAVAEGVNLQAEGIGDPVRLLALGGLCHGREVEAWREDPEVGEDTINNHPQELSALVLDHLAKLGDRALQGREELVKIDQVHGSIAAASDLCVRRVRADLHSKIVASGDQRLEHALTLLRERASRLG